MTILVFYIATRKAKLLYRRNKKLVVGRCFERSIDDSFFPVNYNIY